MDLLSIVLTIASWTKYGNKVISIIALFVSFFEMIASFYAYNVSDHNEGLWGSFVGVICFAICLVRIFGKGF